VAEGGVLGAWVIDAQPAMRRIVILAKVELMKLVFMVLRLMIGFYGVLLYGGELRICQTEEKMAIGL
jgi:hypothetical protein